MMRGIRIHDLWSRANLHYHLTYKAHANELEMPSTKWSRNISTRFFFSPVLRLLGAPKFESGTESSISTGQNCVRYQWMLLFLVVYGYRNVKNTF